MDTEELILQQALLLKAQLFRVASSISTLGAMPNSEEKLNLSVAVSEATKEYADTVEYLVAQ